jgi:osmotically inducible protein OsmC
VSDGGFGLAVALNFEAPQIGDEEAAELMSRVHELCPYSKATRGNIDVALTVGGTSVSRRAA